MTMELTLSTELYSSLSQTRLQQLVDYAALEAVAFDFEAELSAIGAMGNPVSAALEANPTVLSATMIRWGTTTNGVELTGSGFGPVSTLSQLENAIQNGIASGAFNAMTIYSGGQTIGSLAFSASGTTLTTGNQQITFGGTLPSGVQDIANLVGSLRQLSDPALLTPEQLNAIIGSMRAYDLESISISDNGTTLLTLTLGTTDITLNVGGATLNLAGDFPTETIGAFLDVLYSFVNASDAGTPITNLNDVAALALDGLTLTGADGTVLIGSTGSIDDLNGAPFKSITIQGTAGNDKIADFMTYDTDTANTLGVDLGGGNDTAVVDSDDLIQNIYYGVGPLEPTHLDGGTGAQDTLMLSDDFGLVSNWYVGANPVLNFADGVFYYFLDGWGSDYYDATTISFERFERVVYDMDHMSILGSDGAETVVFNVSDNGVYNQSLSFSGGAGTDTLDLSQVDRGDGRFGLTAAEFLDVFSLSIGSNGLNSALNLYSLALNSSAYSEMFLQDVEQVIVATAAGGTQTMTLADVFADKYGAGFQLGTGAGDVLIGSDAAVVTDPDDFFATNEMLGQGGDDFLLGDGLPVAAAADVSAQVYRLYQATLDRAPDLGGHQGWTTQIFTGQATLLDAARGFVNAREFTNTYGDLTDDEFIEQMYLNVLDRPSDQDGKDGWVARMADGATRADVAVGFANSGEFIRDTRADATAYAQAATPTEGYDAMVFRFYQAALTRTPDAGGFEAWLDSIARGMPIETVAAGFANASEFTNMYGSLDNDAFIEQMYVNVLGRPSDEPGKKGWQDRMAAGDTKADVLLGFANSGEFITTTTAQMTDWMRTSYSVYAPDDRLVGGSGDNILSGGLWADTFVFEAYQGGTHTVLDFEAWDYLMFEDFGYFDYTEVMSHMTQQGDDVVFDDLGVTVTLLNTELAEVTEASVYTYDDYLS